MKILKNREYRRMENRITAGDETIKCLLAENKRFIDDCENLRRQLNEQIGKLVELQNSVETLRVINAKRKDENENLKKKIDRMKEALSGKIDILFTPAKCQCDECKEERSSCKKVTFGDTDYCIIPRMTPPQPKQ